MPRFSHDTTKGGRRLKEATARSNARASAYLGCWAVAGRLCHVAGCQFVMAGVFDIAKDASVVRLGQVKMRPLSETAAL